MMDTLGWRSIESAPKDGTHVWVHCPDNFTEWESWWTGEEWFCNDMGLELEPSPTHWQPLPDPPQDAC